MYLLTSKIAWAFQIEEKPGIVYRDDDYTPTGLSQPNWFDFKLVPRDGREAVVQQVYNSSAWVKV
jgi:hypothetical protein